MNNKKHFKWVAIIGIIILIGLSLGTIGYIYTQVTAFEKVFAENVYIENLAVGGLTKEEAKAKLEQNISDKMSKQVLVFTNEELSIEVPFSNLGITYNINETLDKAFNIGHDEDFFTKYHIAQNGLQDAQLFGLTRSIDEDKIDSELKACADKFYVEPINATLDRKNRQFITTKEVNGSTMDIGATKEKALTALNQITDTDSHRIEVEVVMQEVIPEFTEASLQDVQTLVSSFSTSYNNASANRNENLKVASEKINCMLLPGEVFYLSNQLEPFTEEEGYRNAGTIVNGKIEDSLGGGICQVSSTLYNAVLLTDLEIVMRQNHSLTVSYVPLGRDATYNTGTIDFKFKNNSGYPIFIEGYCENNQVVTNIYGHKSLKSEYDIKFESEVTEVIPAPATKYVDDATLDEGKEVVDVTAIDGKRVNLYKLYYKNGVLERRVLVNTSYYRARAAVIKRGTKKKIATDTTETIETPTINNSNGDSSGTNSNQQNGHINTTPDSTASSNSAPSPESSKQPDDSNSSVGEPTNNVNDFSVIQG